MITHRATLDVSTNLLKMATGAVARPRRRDRRPWQRAASVHRQALLVLRFLRDATPVWRLARDIDVSTATGYRYLHEALTALAELAPTLEEAVEAAMANGAIYLCLDGTLVPIDRVDVRKPDGRHLFYSGKHKAFGVNVQVIATPTGEAIWVSPATPGSVNDITAAREHVLSEIAPYISRHTRRDDSTRLVALADKGYIGADVGVLTPPEASPRCAPARRRGHPQPAADRHARRG